PRLSIPLWRGRHPVPRKVVLTNLFNHEQTPVHEGWSVRRRQVRDFRGKGMTYDSHNGTDLCIALGTTVLTAAAGRVVRVISDFNRGGLKIFIDHGRGLMTCYAHMARSVVVEGQTLRRGEVIGLSGYSGLDGFITFPWGVPHVHLNTWLNGEPVDPFANDGRASLWRAGALPLPPPAHSDETVQPSTYDHDRVHQAIASCLTPRVRVRLNAIKDHDERAVHTIIEMNYYPTRFAKRSDVYSEPNPRDARLDLPFLESEFDGVMFWDEGERRPAKTGHPE
ncbi:MAG: hypothetical protein ACI9MC_002343, partial [Kiritimatiellia bacterium]